MAGDTANPRIWTNADVYTAEPESTIPANTTAAWAAAWDDLGLLGEDGMTESRDQDVADHYAWGGVLVRTTRSKHKRTFTVVALEDNPVVFALVNPGSLVETAGGVTTRTIIVPEPDPRMFGFELRDGDITKRLVVPRGEIVEVGDVTYSDDELVQRELTINVYPTVDEVLFGTTDSVLYVEITDDPQAAAGS